jgi:hypothetical protein
MDEYIPIQPIHEELEQTSIECKAARTIKAGLAEIYSNCGEYGLYIFVSSNRFKCSSDHAKHSFHRSANLLVGKVANSAKDEVMLHLVNSKCFLLLLYCLEACPLDKSEQNSLNFTAMPFYLELFRSSNSDLITECNIWFSLALIPRV